MTVRTSRLFLILPAALALACWYFGANVWHSILVAAAITTVVCVAWVVSALEVGRSGWQADDRGRAKGARNDVSSLSWSLRSGWGRVGLTAERRLKGIARRRLALYQLDLQSPRDRAQIEQLVGRRAYRAIAPNSRRELRMRALLHCLDVLDTLDPIRSPAPAASRRTSSLRKSPRRRIRER
jgi:hypothetical protein